MRSDALFFLAVIAFFFILWYASGGPTKPISFAGPYITPITDVDTVQEGYGEGESYSVDGSGSVWGDLMNIQDTLASLQRKASDIRAFGEESPYRGQVSVSAGGTGAEDPDEEYVTLRATGDQPVDITGWRLVSGASGRGERIPEGAAMPRSGRVNDTGRIILQPGDEAVVVTGESPIGVSFKENMCAGYLGRNQDFYPSLRNSCPSAYEEFDRFFEGNELRDDRCYALMQSTPSCTTPRSSNVSNACEELIDEYLDYNGCVEHHRYDAGFAGTTWRIYLEEDRELWKPARDAVKLLDASGKTVDLYTY